MHHPTEQEIIAQSQQDFADSAIRIAVNRLVTVAHTAAFDAGWWTDVASGMNLKRVINTPEGAIEKRLAKALVSEKLMLSVSEVAEAMEGHRKNLMDDKLPHLTMLEVEIADAFIRLGDLAGALGLDIGTAVVQKMAFNRVRPDHKIEARAAEGGKAY